MFEEHGADGLPGATDSLVEEPRNQDIVPGFDVLIELSGSDIELSWFEQGAGLTYEVWRSSDAYFEPGDVDAVQLSPDAAGLAHTDLGAGADDPTDYYYRVRAIDAELEILDSTIVGKNVYGLSNGYTNLGLCLINDVDTASELFAEVGPTAISAHKWDEAIQSWTWSWASSPGTGIGFSPGEAVAINVGDGHPAQYTAVGYVPTSDDVQVELLPGINILTMLPYALGTMMASDLMSIVPGATEVLWWDPAAQSTVTYSGPDDEDFELTRCGHVKLEVTEPSMWPPVWCPQESGSASLTASGGTVQALDVIVEIDQFDVIGSTEVRVAVHGDQLNPETPSYPDETCSGGVIEVMPATDDPALLAEPSGTITLSCTNGNEVRGVEHARADGTFEYTLAVCDDTTGQATLEFSGFGHFTLDETVFPGCETCPLGQGVAVCDVDSWWPPHGECYAAANEYEEAVIGPDGGVLAHPGGATLLVPAGAVAEPLTFNIDVAWEILPHQKLPDGAIAPWRILTGERQAWLVPLEQPVSLTFDCGPDEGRLLVEHQYDFQQNYVVDCIGGEATVQLDRLGYVIPRGLVETTTIDGSGGVVTTDSGAEVIVPAGALSESVEISVVPILDGLGPAIATRKLGDSYALLPHGLYFDLPVEVRLPAPDCVPGRTTVWFREDERADSWTEYPATCNDGVAVTARNSFSVGAPVDPVDIGASECSCLCGEDIREPLTRMAEQMLIQWLQATPAQQLAACGELEFVTAEVPLIGEIPAPIPIGGTGRITKNGWDIAALAFSERKRYGLEPNTQPSTVTIDGQCYFAGEVNYFIWGVTERLCDHAGHGLGPGMSTAAIWKHRLDNGDALEAAPGRVSWSNAGYDAIGEEGGIPLFTPSGLVLNSSWTAPKNNVTKASEFKDRLKADIDCEPVPNERPYQGLQPPRPDSNTPVEGPFDWSWGGQGHQFSGRAPVASAPSSSGPICARDDSQAATLGQEGILVAIAPNDDGVYPNLGVAVESHGVFSAVASYEVDGIPHVELSSQIPTTFDPVETIEYTYQPEEGGIPENLQALIEIEPTCPIPLSDRAAEFDCSCVDGRGWNPNDGACCPENQTYSPITGECLCNENEGYFQDPAAPPGEVVCLGCEDIDPADPYWDNFDLQCEECPHGAIDDGTGTNTCVCDLLAGFAETSSDPDLECECAPDVPYYNAASGDCEESPSTIIVQYRWFGSDGADLDTRTFVIEPPTGDYVGWCSYNEGTLLSGWSDTTSLGGTEYVYFDLANALTMTDEIAIDTNAWWYWERYAGGVQLIVSDGLDTIYRQFNVTPQASECVASPQALSTITWSAAEGLRIE